MLRRALCSSLLLPAGLFPLVGCGEGSPGGPGPRGSGPSVVSVSPARNAVGADRSGPLEVRFAEPVDPASLDPSAVAVFGRWSGVIGANVSPAADGTGLLIVPDRPFHPGERVTVTVASGAVRTPDGALLEPGHSWTFRAAAGPADLEVTYVATVPVRLPGEGHVQTYGAYAGDLDGDGDSDLVVPNEKAADLRVFLNDGTGGYDRPVLHPIPGGDTPSTNEGADFDGDGTIDLAVGNIGNAWVSVFRGGGDGSLDFHVNLDGGAEVRGLCVLDLEANGSPDLVSASVQGNRVTAFRNDGSADFTVSATVDAGGGETSCATADFDEDGLLDVVVGSRGDHRLTVLLSDGEGGLRPSWEGSAGGVAWMLAAGDVDGDGHADVVAVNSRDGELAVFSGDGQGTLEPAAEYSVVGFPLAVDLGDLDGDGDLDVLTSQFESGDFAIFENLGDGTLRTHARLPAGTAGSCTVLHDRDGDGDVDVTGIDELDDLLILFEN